MGILYHLFSALPDFFKTVLVSGIMRTVFVPDGQKIPGTLDFTGFPGTYLLFKLFYGSVVFCAANLQYFLLDFKNPLIPFIP